MYHLAHLYLLYVYSLMIYKTTQIKIAIYIFSYQVKSHHHIYTGPVITEPVIAPANAIALLVASTYTNVALFNAP